MGRDPNETNGKKPSPQGVKKAKKGKTNFVAFNPNKEQKAEIRADKTATAEVIEALSGWVNAGNKLNIGWNEERGSFFAVLRDGQSDWQDAICLSAWHADLNTALRALLYALNGPYANFPAIQLNLFEDLEW